MKTIIFQLFICFCVIFNSFAGVTYLDEEPVVAARNQTNALNQSIFDRIDDAAKECARAKTNRNSDIPKWEDSVPIAGFSTNSTKPYADILDEEFISDIPPPITNNNFKIVFPKLYTRDNYLVMTNAQYSRRYRRTLSFSEFTTTGCKSLDFDVTVIHPIILNYLNLSSARVIREDMEMTQTQLRKATDKLDEQRRKLEGQIGAMEMMSTTEQLGDAIDAAMNTEDVIHNIMAAMEPMINTMIATDMDEDAATDTIKKAFASRRAALDSARVANDKMRGILKEQKDTRKQIELISYREFLRGQTDQETIKKSRPTSMEVYSTEEYIDKWGNRYTVPKSSIVNFNYDK